MLDILRTGTAEQIVAALRGASSLSPDARVELAAIAKTDDSAVVRKAAKAALEAHAPADASALATMKSLAGDDKKVTKQLTALAAAGYSDVAALAVALAARTRDHLGLAYLCEQGGPHARRALQASIVDGALDLSGVRTIPSELAELEELRTLAVRSCGLRAIPPAILALRQLRELDLGANKLAAVPHDIAQLGALERLELQGNPLTKGLGRGLFELTGLRRLTISNTKLTALPAEIGKLRSLEVLYLWNNELLAQLPDELGQLARLRAFSVSHSKQIASIPRALWSLTTLEELDLSGLELGRLPDELGGLVNLKDLQLRGCAVELPDTIGQLASLEVLDLVFARIAALPESFYALPRLRRMRVQYSPLDPAAITARMPDVTIFQ